MNESTLDRNVSTMLLEFESIEEIQPSTDWNNSLMERLTYSKPYFVPLFLTTKIAVIFLLFVLINLGFVFNSVIGNSPRERQHDKEFIAISKEFLINPISINN